MKTFDRRVAAHEAIRDGKTFAPAVIELCNHVVTDCRVLTHEFEKTEWLGGTIYVITDEEGFDRACWNDKIL